MFSRTVVRNHINFPDELYLLKMILSSIRSRLKVVNLPIGA